MIFHHHIHDLYFGFVVSLVIFVVSCTKYLRNFCLSSINNYTHLHSRSDSATNSPYLTNVRSHIQTQFLHSPKRMIKLEPFAFDLRAFHKYRYEKKKKKIFYTDYSVNKHFLCKSFHFKFQHFLFGCELKITLG